jgi:hypothetical protein
MGKVIDLTSRLKTMAETAPVKSVADVLSYEEQKKLILVHERRNIKRTILSEFISAMVVIPEKGLIRVGIYDISDNGVSFDMELENGSFSAGEEISMRVYLNHKTYFPIHVTVKHVTNEPLEGVVRHGTEFAKNAVNDAALLFFVKFIETVSLGLKKDEGDLMAPNIS